MRIHRPTPFTASIDGVLWTNIRRDADGTWWADAGFDSSRFPAEQFAYLLPQFLEWERSEGRNQPATGSQQLRSSFAADSQQTRSSFAAELQQPRSTSAARRTPTEASLRALERARLVAKPQAFEVVSRWWPIVRWLEAKAGLAVLHQAPAFPRSLAREANERFAELLQRYPPRSGLRKKKGEGWHRSERFYKGLVESYFEYKSSIEVPIWWLRFEVWFEDNFYKHLID